LTLDPDQCLGRLFDERGHQLVELPHPGDAVGNTTFGQRSPGVVFHTDVVVGFCPVHADEDCHCASSRCREPEEAIGPLMEVLAARHPTSRVGILTDQQRHDLDLGLEVRRSGVLIC